MRGTLALCKAPFENGPHAFARFSHGAVHATPSPRAAAADRRDRRPVPAPDERRGPQRFLSGTGTLRTTTILGSPAYMPPEQLQGAELTEAVDVWALAMLLWETMAEAKPWDGVYSDFAQLKDAVCRGERVPIPPSAAAAFPAGYVAVIRAGTSQQVPSPPRPFLLLGYPARWSSNLVAAAGGFVRPS